MISLKQITLLFDLTLVCLVLGNCNPNRLNSHDAQLAATVDTQIPLSSTQPTSKPTQTTPLQAFTSTPHTTAIQKIPPYLLYTPIPTIVPSAEQRMVSLLHSNDCELPCYLGITPGKTPWKEAQGILESIGASSSGEWKEENLPVHGYNLWVGDPSVASVTPDSNTGVGDLEIAQSIGIMVENDIVQSIGVSIQTSKFAEKYRNYWSRYALGELLRRVGKPDNIYFGISEIGTGYSIFIVYENLATVLEFNGEKKGNEICPLLQEKNGVFTKLTMTLINKKALPDLFAQEKTPPFKGSIYLPIRDSLGIDEKEFYNRLLLDPSTCFEIKETN